MEAAAVAGLFVGFAYGSILLGGYIYGMFHLWRHVGSHMFAKFNRVVILRTIGAGALFLGSLAMLLPIDPILRLTTALIVAILHGTPAFTGFMVGVAGFDQEDQLLREQRTVRWLMEWEDARAGKAQDADDA